MIFENQAISDGLLFYMGYNSREVWKVKALIIKTNAIKSALDYFGSKVNSPEQRLMLGATALLTQPLIDLSNKKVDKETRKTSVARTIAKILAGTAVGVAVRYGGIKLIDKMSKYHTRFNLAGEVSRVIPKSRWDIFVPSFKDKSLLPKTEALLDKEMLSYKKSMGTLLATVAMIATNFLLDAPLTKYFTDVFTRKINKNFNSTFEENKTGGVNADS